MTRRALLQWGIQQLKAEEVEAARRTAEWMLADVLDCRRVELHAYPEQAVDERAQAAFAAKVARRKGGEPLQYILGHADFYGLCLEVTPAVLIPRPETEQVVEKALRLLGEVEAPRVLDAGTGSGCMALAVKHERADARVWACDASEKALAIARANAARHELDVRFAQVDLLVPEASEGLPPGLDLLLSNPPYIPRDEESTLSHEVRGHEPPEALFCGDDPLRFYRVLARLGTELLAPGGWLVVEAHAHYAEEVCAFLKEKGLVQGHVQEDLAGRPRVVAARQRLESRG